MAVPMIKEVFDKHYQNFLNQSEKSLWEVAIKPAMEEYANLQPPPVEVEQAAAIKFPIDDSMPEGMKYNQGSKREGFIEGFKVGGQWEEFALGLLNFMHNKGIEIDYTLDTPAIFGEEEGFLSFEELIKTFKAAQTK